MEAGEEVVITRRGVAIARIVAEPAHPADGCDLQERFDSPIRNRSMTGRMPPREGGIDQESCYLVALT